MEVLKGKPRFTVLTWHRPHQAASSTATIFSWPAGPASAGDGTFSKVIVQRETAHSFTSEGSDRLSCSELVRQVSFKQQQSAILRAKLDLLRLGANRRIRRFPGDKTRIESSGTTPLRSH